MAVWRKEDIFRTTNERFYYAFDLNSLGKIMKAYETMVLFQTIIHQAFDFSWNTLHNEWEIYPPP